MTGEIESSAKSSARRSAEIAAARAHRAAATMRGIADSLLPWLDLITRISLGLAFLRIAIRGAVMGIPMAMADGGGGFFDALLASPFGFTIQALCPVLLVAGAATRLAALPLVVQDLLLTSPDGPSELEHFRAAAAAILLVQAGPRLLPAFPPSLSAEAAEALVRLGVELRLDARVEGIDDGGVVVSGTRIAARTVLWAAGVEASPAAIWLDAPRDRAGRIAVEPDLTVPGHPEIFAVGDTVASKAWRGCDVPGSAPAARQGGAYAARVIRARLRGRPAPPPFRYRHLGSLATIGRQAAVADFSAIRFRGGLAWWLWSVAHIAFIYGGRNRAAVLLDWAWAT